MQRSLFIKGYFLLCFAFLQCTPHEEFRAIKDIKNNEWPENKKHSFKFEITDNSKVYDVNFLIRNNTEYPFYNLYLKRTLSDSTGKVISKRMEEVILFDEKSGKPLGGSLGDIFDHKFRSSSLKNYRFPSKGKYTLTVEQFMRQNPLKGVVSIGVTVEPIYPK